MPVKITTQYFIDKANLKHNNKYCYDKVIYKSARSYVIITCPIHGDFEQTPDAHGRGQGCPKCKIDKLSKLFISNNKDFINKANLIHNNKYDYSLVRYKRAHDAVIIICNLHGKFKQNPNNHLSGSGCAECIGVGQSNNERFIRSARAIHGDKFDYSRINYSNNKKQITIVCHTHGEFLQTPDTHLRGGGCKICNGKEVYDTQSFKNKASAIHNYLYDYSKVEYVGSKNIIIIICSIHGSFKQNPHNHLNGKGCPSCSHRVSKPEKAWIKSFNNPNIVSNITINVNSKKYSVDGFDPLTNTVYEFNGDFWHGNPKFYKSSDVNRANKKTYGELYEKTLEKEKALKSAGYKVISIWENDFKEIV